MLLCDRFFDCAFLFNKSVAEMTFSLAYVLNVVFVALYHINEISRRAGDVMSCMLFAALDWGYKLLKEL